MELPMDQNPESGFTPPNFRHVHKALNSFKTSGKKKYALKFIQVIDEVNYSLEMLLSAD